MSKTLSGKELLPEPELFALTMAQRIDSGWLVEADGPNRASCPDCQKVSTSRHSRCWRTLKDLPAQGTPVTLRLRLSRWRCRNPSCNRKFFSSVLPKVMERYGRRTKRADAVVMLVGHALGGRAGERLLHRLNICMSDDTILRCVKQAARERSAAAVRVIGVDDWAWKRAHNYGTILVDLERRKVIDLLPKRSGDALVQWLKAHPEIQAISRDRHGPYSEGAQRGAPQAIQVADRFHLVLNLRQAVERELAVQRKYLAVQPNTPAGENNSGLMPAIEKERAITLLQESSVEARRREIGRQRREQKLELFRQAKLMKAAGWKVSRIAARLGVNRRRLDRWLLLEELPERNKMAPRAGMAESFREYLCQRWKEGCHHGLTLFAEIRKLGYVGCFSALARFLSTWRTKTVSDQGTSAHDEPAQLPVALPTASRQISPQVGAALLSKPRPDLTDRQAEIVDLLKAQCPEFAVMRKLVLSFRAILHSGKIDTLHEWMRKAKATGIHSLKRFVRTLHQDQKAVEAAVTEV